jgi:CubicO group peptidase (beta-lactamase class C family)
MIPGFSLDEAVRAAWSATGIPGVVAGLSVDGARSFAAAGILGLGGTEAVSVDTPFRIASITKPFVASLCAEAGVVDDRVERLLSHTAGLRCESAVPLPDECAGLWSYSNAGYWEAGAAAAAACGLPFEQAMRSRVLEPLELDATGFETPSGRALGHVQEGETGHRVVPEDAYPVARRPSGGLWSTAADLLRFGEWQLDAGASFHEPRARALGGGYGLGWWSRELAGRTVLDHEGSAAGYQTLLLLVPEERLVLAVLTNSWRGSGLVRRVVAALGLVPRLDAPDAVDPAVGGTYGLDGTEAAVAVDRDGTLSVQSSETDPITGTRIETRFPVQPLGSHVFGFAGGVLQSHRLDFPSDGVARVGWLALPRIDP